MEGCTGVSYRAQMSQDSSAPGAYSRAQRFATDDCKAAIEGVLSFEPDAEILFNDAHGRSLNIFFEEFPDNVQTVAGSQEMLDAVFGLDDTFDALICIGAHGTSLTMDAILCHIWSARDVKFNDKSLSETGLSASLAGYYGIPLVAVSGDEATLNTIKSNISERIATAVVKKGYGMYTAICINPRISKKLIKEAVLDGLTSIESIPPLRFKNPVSVEIDWRWQSQAAATKFFIPSDERISATRTRYIADNATEAYYGFLARNKICRSQHNLR